MNIYRGYTYQQEGKRWCIYLEGKVLCDLPSEEAVLDWIDKEKRRQRRQS